MRCVHCGKEVKNNVIFCIHCDRPVKHEYSHYACEFYDSLSFKDKIANAFTSHLPEKKTYKQDSGYRKTTDRSINLRDTIKEKSNTIKQKGSAIKQLYDNYTYENSNQSESKARREEPYEQMQPKQNDNFDINLDESDTYKTNNNLEEYTRYNDQDPEYFDLKNFKESTKKTVTDFKNASEEEQKNILKVVGIVIAIIFFFISLIFSGSSSNDYDSYDEYDEAYEYAEDYNFPENPAIFPGFKDSINSCSLGSEELVINYLKLLYEDTTYMRTFDAPLYTLEDFEPYISQIEQIEADYENNPSYEVYSELIYTKDLWQQLIRPIYENPEYYEEWEIEDNANDFYDEVAYACDYYLKNEF